MALLHFFFFFLINNPMLFRSIKRAETLSSVGLGSRPVRSRIRPYRPITFLNGTYTATAAAAQNWSQKRQDTGKAAAPGAGAGPGGIRRTAITATATTTPGRTTRRSGADALFDECSVEPHRLFINMY